MDVSLKCKLLDKLKLMLITFISEMANCLDIQGGAYILGQNYISYNGSVFNRILTKFGHVIK